MKTNRRDHAGLTRTEKLAAVGAVAIFLFAISLIIWAGTAFKEHLVRSELTQTRADYSNAFIKCVSNLNHIKTAEGVRNCAEWYR